MAKYAYFDSTAPSPSLVIGWYDTDLFAYPTLPAPADLLTLTAAQWEARMNGLWAIVAGEMVPFTHPAPTSWVVPWPTVRARLEASEHFAAAAAALVANPALLVTAITVPGPTNTDAAAIAFFTSIGADPTVILAAP